MANTKITVVGCGDAFGSGGKLHACFYVQSDHTNLLLDCGATSYYGMKRLDIDVRDIDVIVISHFHGDHYGGLPFLLLERAIHHGKSPLTVISPPTGKERIAYLLDQLYPGTDVLGKLAVQFEAYLPDTAIKASGLEVRAFPVIHTPETLPHGLRIQVGGKVIGYSGDTEWTPVLIELARGADVFICECNFYELEVAGHMNYKTLQTHVGQLDHQRIMLTHLGPEMFRNRHRIMHECADDGLEIVL